MKESITCPHCNQQFEITEALQRNLKIQLEHEMNDWKKSKETFYISELEKLKHVVQSHEEETNKKISDTREKVLLEVESDLKQKLQNEFEVKLKALEENNLEKENLLKLAREKELEFLKKTRELKDKEDSLEIEFQRKILEETDKIKNSTIQNEAEKQKIKEEEYKFKLTELQEKYNQQLKLVEEMSKKGAQGSMQLQGEVQEILLETLLKETFPDDELIPVPKGVSGGDTILRIKNKSEEVCGSILFESKRTKNFEKGWLDKLSKDKGSSKSDIAVLVTQALPKDYNGFIENEGIWITSFSEVKSLIFILRDLLIRTHHITKANNNITDKMNILYQYFVSAEFNNSWELIKKGFVDLRNAITTERNAMEKSWKSREKQLDSILLNVSHIKGSIDGISGQSKLDFGFYLEENKD